MKIVFDMDGTIADLYGVPCWLEKLRAYDSTPFAHAKPMWDMKTLSSICESLAISGIEIIIVTWLSKESTKDYDAEVTQVKKEWLEKNGFYYNQFHAVSYGISKSEVVKPYLRKNEKAILIDDNAEVRKAWTLGDTINPQTENILKILKEISKNPLTN